MPSSFDSQTEDNKTEESENKSSGTFDDTYTSNKTSEQQAYTASSYFSKELMRYENEAKEIKSKTQRAERQDNMPYVYNSFFPYLDLNDLKAAVNMRPEEECTREPLSRRTAGAPCDPLLSWTLDQLQQPPDHGENQGRPKRRSNNTSGRSSGRTTARKENNKENKGGNKNRKEEEEKQSQDSVSSTTKDGSESDDEEEEGRRREKNKKTISCVPEYRIVPSYKTTVKDSKGRDKTQLQYSDVPEIRSVQDRRYGRRKDHPSTSRDYERAKKDLKPLHLDRLNDFTPASRDSLRQACLAYLSVTPGTARAVRECIRTQDKEFDEEKAEVGWQEDKRKVMREVRKREEIERKAEQ